MRRLKSYVLVSPLEKRLLYSACALLWLSGAVWLYLHYFGQVQTDYGPQVSPWQPLCLKIHGAAAMGFLMILGAFFLQHVPAGWQQKNQRPSGSSLIAVAALLVVTGWGLYYVGSERLRHATSLIHSMLGFCLP